MATKPTRANGVSRRQFLQGTARTGSAMTACGVALSAWVLQSRALPARTLRPPGALTETDFLAACVHCALCVRACPYHALRLADAGEGPALGTPFFVARAVPCEMCDDIPCVKACPTGALAKSLTEIEKCRIGTAVLVSRETCLNLLGLRCDVCYRDCPLLGKAITLEERHNTRTGRHAILEPTVHSEHCTGCGKCEHACVLEEAAIKVLPVALARGKLAASYRLGWNEKQKAGAPLVPDIVELPRRLPEARP